MRITLHLIVSFGVLMSANSEEITDINEELSPEVKAHLFEGDIKLTPEQRRLIDEAIVDYGQLDDKKSGQRKATSNIALRWPIVGGNAQVPYRISYSSRHDTDAIEGAIRHWEIETCVKFIPRTDETDFIEFIRDDGCWSSLGKIGGKQSISIGVGCGHGGIVTHEIGHAIGFWHEHTRPDRDEYITVHFENIQSGSLSQFDKKPLSEVETGGISYDVGSIMHYSQTAFSKNGQPTITAKNPADNSKLGNRQALSAADIKLANTIFGCRNVCPTGWTDYGGSCYKMVGMKTFAGARNACQQANSASYVVVVNDAAENTVVGAMASYGVVWGGCNALGGNRLWTCPDGSGKTFDGNTGTASPANSYWNWQYNANGDCQMQRRDVGYKWSSITCGTTLPVICEMQK